MCKPFGMATAELIGSGEACRIVGVDRATLLRWREAGVITEAMRLPGETGAWLFHRADVEQLARDRAAKAS